MIGDSMLKDARRANKKKARIGRSRKKKFAEIAEGLCLQARDFSTMESSLGKWVEHALSHDIEKSDDDLYATEVTAIPLDTEEQTTGDIAIALDVDYVINFALAAKVQKDVVCNVAKEKEKLRGVICKRHGVRTKDYPSGTGNPPKRYPNSCLFRTGQKYVYTCRAGPTPHKFKKQRISSVVELTFVNYLKYIDMQVVASRDGSNDKSFTKLTSFPDFWMSLEGADDETRNTFRVSDEYEEYV